MEKVIEEEMENLNKRWRALYDELDERLKAKELPGRQFAPELDELERLDYFVRLAEIHVEKHQLHLRLARQRLSNFIRNLEDNPLQSQKTEAR